MRFLHLADLHIGKVVNGFSMLEDQAEILRQIREIARREQADCVVIAGDVYDRPIPPAEAVELLDGFLTGLAEDGIPVLMAAGNHDSGVRLGFAGRILETKGLVIAGSPASPLKKVTFQDSYGEVAFFLLPFFKPAALKEVLGEMPETTEEGIQKLIERESLSGESRNVLVTHFFVTAKGQQPELSDSETTVQVGGTDRVDAGLFAAFDYTALGHLHKCQRMGEGQVWYAGSPLKYSFSEVQHEKTVLLAELQEKGNMELRRIPLHPLHDMRKIRGELEILLRPEIAGLADQEDYLCVTLTDEEELLDPIGSLRKVYPNVMQLILEKNSRLSEEASIALPQKKQQSMPELYREFFEQVTGRELDEERKVLVQEAFVEAGGMEE